MYKNYQKLLLLSSFLLNLCHAEAQSSQSKYSWDHLPSVSVPAFKKDTIQITQYGAKPDGHTLNTSFINKAIQDCSSKGGGLVKWTCCSK